MMPSALLPACCQILVHLPPAATTPGMALMVKSRGAGGAAGPRAGPRPPPSAACCAGGMQGDWPNRIADAASQDEIRNTVLCFNLPPGTKHTLYAQPGALLGANCLDNREVADIFAVSPADVRMLNFHPQL